MREVRVAMIGAGVISHRHMTIYENIQKIYRLNSSKSAKG